MLTTRREWEVCNLFLMSRVAIVSKSVFVAIHSWQGLKMAIQCLTTETVLASSLSEQYGANFRKQFHRTDFFVSTMNPLLFKLSNKHIAQVHSLWITSILCSLLSLVELRRTSSSRVSSTGFASASDEGISYEMSSWSVFNTAIDTWWIQMMV